MKRFDINKKNQLIGMVHCLPLPGTKDFDNDISKIFAQALQDAQTLEKAGMDAIMIENMGDNPFSANLDTEQVTALAAVSRHIKDNSNIPIGIDAAFNDYKAALAIAKIVGADFVRIPVFVDTVVYYGGIVYPVAKKALAYRKKLQAENIQILADIHVKHSHLLIPSITIEESAKNAVMAGADGIILTGSSIGQATPIELLKRVKKVVEIPIYIGSGANKDNLKSTLPLCQGAIVGSSIKKGALKNPVDFDLSRELVNIKESIQ